MRSAPLPAALRESLSRLADQLPGKELARAAAHLEDAARASLPPRLDDSAVRIACAITRMPAVFSAVFVALEELPFQPASVLDLGAGPATAAWICKERFDAYPQVTLVEPDPGWRELASAMLAPEATWIDSDLRRLTPPEPHDLVIAAYSLAVLTEKERSRLLEEAWFVTRHALLIVQPGSPREFDSTRAMRSWLIENGARIQAPCPHETACPVPQGGACRFAVRLDRSKAHRIARGGGLGFQDETFSYVLALKEEASPAPARIVGPPAIRSHLIDLPLCTSNGLERARVTKRDKDAWKAARKAEWGGKWGLARISPTSDLRILD